MQQTSERVLDGCTWQLKQHGTSEGLTCFVNLSRILGEAVTVLLSQLPEGKGAVGLLDAEIGGGLIAKAVDGLLARLDDDKVVWLVRLLTKYVSRDGKSVAGDAFDEVFAGRYRLLGQVLLWVVEENFAECFGSSDIEGMLRSVSGRVSAGRPPVSVPHSGSGTEE